MQPQPNKISCHKKMYCWRFANLSCLEPEVIHLWLITCWNVLFITKLRGWSVEMCKVSLLLMPIRFSRFVFPHRCITKTRLPQALTLWFFKYCYLIMDHHGSLFAKFFSRQAWTMGISGPCHHYRLRIIAFIVAKSTGMILMSLRH